MISYLDNSATTKQYTTVTEKMIEVMESNYGNPSSLHKLGFESSKAIREARESLAEAVGFTAKGVIFTASGSEANNLAIRGVAKSKRRVAKRLVTTVIEHPATIETFKDLEKDGWDTEYLNVNEFGTIDLSQLKAVLAKGDVALVSIMHVNNEIGSISDIEKIGKIIKMHNEVLSKEKKIVFHVDAIQSFKKIPIPTANVDLVSLSAHKIHGPKGVGALLCKESINLPAVLTGGGQERGIRPGTENVAGIIGFGNACKVNVDVEKISKIKNYLQERILSEIEGAKLNSPLEGAPQILNISFEGIRGEVLLHLLEEDSIYISTGSACSSNKKGQSHVLKSIGLNDEEIESAIRFSIGALNEYEEVEYVVNALKKHITRMRKLNKLRK